MRYRDGLLMNRSCRISFCKDNYKYYWTRRITVLVIVYAYKNNINNKKLENVENYFLTLFLCYYITHIRILYFEFLENLC